VYEQVVNNSLIRRPHARNKTNIEVTQKFMSHLSSAPLDDATKTVEQLGAGHLKLMKKQLFTLLVLCLQIVLIFF